MLDELLSRAHAGGIFPLRGPAAACDGRYQGQRAWQIAQGQRTVAGPLESSFRAANRLGDEDFSALATAWDELAADGTVTAGANEAGIAMVHTGLRLFWH